MEAGKARGGVINMIMTVLEGQVAPEKWSVLEQAYKKGPDTLPPPIVQTFLVQSAAAKA